MTEMKKKLNSCVLLILFDSNLNIPTYNEQITQRPTRPATLTPHHFYSEVSITT